MGKGAWLLTGLLAGFCALGQAWAQEESRLQVSVGSLPEGWTTRDTSRVYEGGVLELHAPGDFFTGGAVVKVTTETPAAFAQMLQEIGAGLPPESGARNFRVSEVNFHGFPALHYQFDVPPVPEFDFQGGLKEGFLFQSGGYYIWVAGDVNAPSIEKWRKEMQQAFAALRFPGAPVAGQLPVPGAVPGAGVPWTTWLPTGAPGLGGIGVLPGPETLAQGLAGVLAPGVLAAILGILGRLPSGATGGGFGLGFGGGSHVLSDGRTYHDGQRYTFHDGVEYVMRNGEMHPVRSLQDGERFTDPDGSQRIWKGGQAWMDSDWEQQAAVTDRYARQHAADWAEESTRLNPELVEFNRQWDEKMKWLDNLHTMERGILYGGEEMDLLRHRGEGGDFRGNIEELIGTFQETGEIDRETYSRMQRIYGMARRGDILDHSAAHTNSDIFANTMREGTERMLHEVVRGADVEGNRSYKSMAVRALANILTAGKAELVYTPANSVYTMRDMVERGSSTREILTQVGWDVGVGEIYGTVFGQGMQRLSPYAGRLMQKGADTLARRFPEATRVVTKKVKAIVHELTRQRGGRSIPKVKIGADGRMTRVDKPVPRTSGKVTRARPPDPAKQTNKGRSPAGHKRAGLQINEESFTPAGKPPALEGVPSRDNRAIKMVADRYGAKVHMRKTNPDSRRWLETKKAHPKPEMLKTKTINQYDVELGYPKDKVGTVACKRPVLPPKKPRGMSDGDWTEVQKRYTQRNTEFVNQQAELNELVRQKKITWDPDTGLITDYKSGKPFAGDHDAFAFVDAETGQPLPDAVVNRINRELQSTGATCHPEHVGWDYSAASPDVPKGAPTGAQSQYEIKAGIDAKILDGHAPGGEPLNTYDPLAAATSRDDWSVRTRRTGDKGWMRESSTKEEGWNTSYWTGGRRSFE